MTHPGHEPRSRRLCLQLDAAVTTESMILAQLDRLPQRRRAEWLRSLLAQGFLAERQRMQELNASPTERSTPVAPPSLAGPPAPAPTRSDPPAPRRQVPTAPSKRKPSPQKGPDQPNDKPFAHLRALIG